MLKKVRFFTIHKKMTGYILILMLLCYTIFGLLHTVQAATKTYQQTVKSGIGAFPESYQVYLKQIQEQHPKWTFDAYYTGISWNDLVANQTDHGHNRIIKTADALWRCSCGNVASGYACASSDIIQYYMDPRNFLDRDKEIFQFLESSYHNNYKVEVVQSIIKNTFMKGNVTFLKDGKKVTMSYAQIIMEAAQASQMSPYAIAIKIIQEVGVNGSNSCNGTYTFTYTDGKQYSGYYNFFNYGAYDTGNAVTNGLIYAKDKGWDTPYKAIVEGAKKYGADYTAKGQNTIYFTKWDVVGGKILKPGQTQTVTASNTSSNQLFRHQYMTNVQDPTNQSSRLFNTYSNNDIIDESLNFVIPVYENMPEANKLPSALTPEDGDLYYTTGTDIMVRQQPTTSGARVDCIVAKDTMVIMLERKTAHNNGLDWDKIKLANGKVGYAASKYLAPCQTSTAPKAAIEGTNIKAVPKLTIQNLAKELNITNYEVSKDGMKKAQTESAGTGYLLKDNNTNKTYTIIVLGDINGDGYVDTGDTFRMKQQIMKVISLEGVYKAAADVNKDSYIDTGDSFMLKKEVSNIPNIRL